MNSNKSTAYKIISTYLETVKKNGFRVSTINDSLYNYDFSVISGKDKIKVQVYFGQKGIKTVLQGNKDSKLFNEINRLIFGENLFAPDSSTGDFEEPVEYIGTDESGKGDYFGPLVVAGVFVDKNSILKLKQIGVKDSKEISDSSIKILAGKIKNIVEDNFEIVVITPSTYNPLYEKIGNVNKILGWAHAKVLANLIKKSKAKEAISDKFGDESFILNSLHLESKEFLLHQITKAEKYTAVAAASILARNKFSEWFDDKKRILQMDLPKGASELVEKAALEIKSKLGKEKLVELVKLHFKTTKKIIFD